MEENLLYGLIYVRRTQPVHRAEAEKAAGGKLNQHTNAYPITDMASEGTQVWKEMQRFTELSLKDSQNREEYQLIQNTTVASNGERSLQKMFPPIVRSP